jgi:hypothetical protein
MELPKKIHHQERASDLPLQRRSKVFKAALGDKEDDKCQKRNDKVGEKGVRLFLRVSTVWYCAPADREARLY